MIKTKVIHRRAQIAVIAAMVAVTGGTGWAKQIAGFTTPYRSADVASPETGIVAELLVREGDVVKKGQVLATLDVEVHRAQLALAEESMQVHGRLAIARAELNLRRNRLDKLAELETRGNARPEEVERAQADVAIAEGQLLALHEELAIKQRQYERAKVQLGRRTIRAPMSGVVARLFKEEGEFIGPNDPQLLTIVQLDPLLAAFSVPSNDSRRMHVGQQVSIELPMSEVHVQGTIEFVAPVVDGESGTVRVRVRLENAEGRYYGGEPCFLVNPTESATDRGGPDSASPEHDVPGAPSRTRDQNKTDTTRLSG